MPKRPCPFEDDLSPQMKIHIGEIEVLKQDKNNMLNIFSMLSMNEYIFVFVRNIFCVIIFGKL